MTRILMMCPHDLHVEVVTELQQLGVEPTLLYLMDRAESQRLFNKFDTAERVSTFELTGGKLPKGSKAHLEAVSLGDLQTVAPFEAHALQMIDRRNYDRKSVQELRWFVLRYISVWRALLDHHRPHAVVLHGTPHQGHDYVLYVLCKASGIPTLMVERTHLNERLFFRHAIDDSPAPTKDEVALERLRSDPHDRRPLDTSHLDALNQELNDVAKTTAALSYRAIASTVLHPYQLLRAARRVTDSVHALSQRQPRRLEYNVQEAHGRLMARDCWDLYRQHQSLPAPGSSYVFLPLHFQPERTTLPDGGFFSDQLNVAALLAEALPPGWVLAVKEHPRQFNLARGIRGVTWSKGRSPQFYQRLIENPKIRLVPLEAPTPDLIRKSRAVATVSGTSGWEALQAGIPALVFGHPWYQHCPGVQRITDVPTCRSVLDAIEEGGTLVDAAQATAWGRVLAERYTFRGCFSDALLSRSSLSAQDNGRLYARAIVDALHTALARRAADTSTAVG